jgi:proteic killer suppression protein
MTICYDNNQLKKLIEDPKKLHPAYGIHSKKILQRISELKAASSLEGVSRIPGMRLHELHVNEKNIAFGINISGNRRMVFEPVKPYPLKEDGGIDLSQVFEISIQVLCKDYH